LSGLLLALADGFAGQGEEGKWGERRLPENSVCNRNDKNAVNFKCYMMI